MTEPAIVSKDSGVEAAAWSSLCCFGGWEPLQMLCRKVHLFQSSRGLQNGLGQKCFYWMLGVLIIGSSTPATSRTPLSAPEAAKGGCYLTHWTLHTWQKLEIKEATVLLASARVFWVAVALGGTGGCEQAWDAEPTARARPPFSTVSWQHVLPFMNSCFVSAAMSINF